MQKGADPEIFVFTKYLQVSEGQKSLKMHLNSNEF